MLVQSGAECGVRGWECGVRDKVESLERKTQNPKPNASLKEYFWG
jgi:hypothetical protein